MSGPEIQANAIETALHGYGLRRNIVRDALLIVFLALIVPLASLRFGGITCLAIALVAGSLYLLAIQIEFDHDTLLPVLYPFLALVLSTALVLRKKVRQAASHRSFSG